MRTVALALALGLVATGCSSKSNSASTSDAGSNDSADQGTNGFGCTEPGDTYVANLTKQGERGTYTFTLVQAVPAPPDLDGNVWTLKITDASGASPDLAQVTVYPFMPQMGHSSDQTPQIAANADGTFQVSDLYLFMDGLWTITVSVLPVAVDAGPEAAPGPTVGPLDEAVFTFCITG